LGKHRKWIKSERERERERERECKRARARDENVVISFSSVMFKEYGAKIEAGKHHRAVCVKGHAATRKKE